VIPTRVACVPLFPVQMIPHVGLLSQREYVQQLHYYDNNIMSAQTLTADSLTTSTLSFYSQFRIALKSKEVKKHPNLLWKFLDSCKFEGLDVEQKTIKFSNFAGQSQEEVEDLVIRFIFKRRG